MLRNHVLYREEVGRGVGREEVERSAERSAGGSVGRRSGASREELQSVANRMLFRVGDMSFGSAHFILSAQKAACRGLRVPHSRTS